ncbi:MAG TPA: sialidase family protein, partial [Chryseosolibacter sp.]|nr:sialidase family protein [Chryseosolibacter sp.]
VSDHKGIFYYFHLSDPTQGKGGYDSEKLDRIVVQQSDDGGFTWTPGESIGFNHPKDQDKQWPAVDAKGNVYVTWTEFDKYGDDNPNCMSRILFSKSKNGKKWTAPLQVSQTPGNCKDDDFTAEGAVPAVRTDGKVFVTWSNQNKIFFDRSYDGGATWLTNDLAIAEHAGGWDIKIPGHDRCNGMPVLVANNSKTALNGQLYVVWADQRNGEDDTDIWFLRTSNNGDNWTAVTRVNDDEKGKHQYLPWMTVDQATGVIYILYYDRRNYEGAETDVYLAYSTNGGNSFTNVRISEKPFTPVETTFFGDYLNIAAHRGIIAAIWARMDDGITSVWTAVLTQDQLNIK